MSNAVLERIHQVLGNLVQTYKITQNYVDEYKLWSVILDVADFAIFSTKNRIEGYILGQLIFVCDMILPIKHTVDWELIHQKTQTQINKYNIR